MTPQERRLAVVSNSGRWLGWNIYLEDVRVCTLSFHSDGDMFWDVYVLSDKNQRFDVESDAFWDTSELRAESRCCKGVFVDNFICRWDDSNEQLWARHLYLTGIRLSLRDRVSLFLLKNSHRTSAAT